MKHNNNPFRGKVEFDIKGNLWIDNDLPFGAMMEPKLEPREWLYLMYTTAALAHKPHYFSKLIASLGSRATIWRTKKQLHQKGYELIEF